MSGTRMGCRLWTEAEDALVRRHYPRHGMRWQGWDELLPHRSLNAIRVRAHGLGVHVDPDVIARNNAKATAAGARGKWRDEEVAKLAALYPLYGASWRGWRDELPGRGCAEIAGKAKALGLRRVCVGRGVTNDDRSRILAAVVALADSLRIPPRAVACEVVRLGLEYERRAS